MDRSAPIGIFDSGIGGLSVVRAIRQALPHERLLYFADQANIPYGERSLDEVLILSIGITDALMARESKLIVVACNAASAAALRALRVKYPAMKFVGMEPAVKPAAEHTSSKVVGVLATTATFQGELFASVMERFAQGVEVIQQACPGLVEQIEAGELESPHTEAMLRRWLEPMLARGVDALALACTHYPFVMPLIEKICGPGVRVIDPAPAVARQTGRILEGMDALATPSQAGHMTCHTSGDPGTFTRRLRLLGITADQVRGAKWTATGLHLA